MVIGLLFKWTVAVVDQAGFAMGMLHGAMMPAAMPNLLAGVDVPIYAVDNNGIPYKLGYTLGVNLCGALFFGMIFWHFIRARKPAAAAAATEERSAGEALPATPAAAESGAPEPEGQPSGITASRHPDFR